MKFKHLKHIFEVKIVFNINLFYFGIPKREQQSLDLKKFLWKP